MRAATLIGLCLFVLGCDSLKFAGKAEFDAPAGWTRKTEEAPRNQRFGRNMETALAPPDDGEKIRTRVILMSEKSNAKLDRYVKATLKMLARDLPGAQKVDETDFESDSGVPGKRIRFNTDVRGRDFRQHTYVFDNGSVKYILTGMALWKNAKRDTPKFDQIAKSFRFE